MHLRSQFAGLPHRDLFSSLTNMGVPGVWPARVNIDTIDPARADTIMNEIADYIKDENEADVAVAPLNVRAVGAARVIFDFDFHDTLTPDEQERRDVSMTEIAELFRRTARQHFRNFGDFVYLAKSTKGNYHIHLPGFVYTEPSVVHLLLKMTRAKAPIDYRELFSAIDMAPIGIMQMRMHGTDNKAREGKGVYTVIHPPLAAQSYSELSVR